MSGSILRFPHPLVALALLAAGVAAAVSTATLAACGDDTSEATGGAGGAGPGSGGATTTTTTTASAMTSTTGTGGATAATCDGYCGFMDDNCTQNPQYRQYPDKAHCLAVCKAWPPGKPGREPVEQKGNNLECRNYWAGAPAAGSPGDCITAGPTGADGTCGENCENFCFLAEKICKGTYADEGACLAACAKFPKNIGGEIAYNDSQTTGDRYSCRMNQLVRAAVDAGKYCPLIVADQPAGPCHDGGGGSGGGGGGP
jgi:hypothetical protein